MAKKKHRKLFPLLASERNKTLDCLIGICDPICPNNCYQEPDYYTISPQLPPWSSSSQSSPSPSPSPSPSISAVYEPSSNPSSTLDAITIISITGAVLAILLTGFFLVAKVVSDSVTRVTRGSYYQSDDEDNDTVNQEEEVDHPIWLIRTTGLQQSVINSITICNYKRGDGLIERTDCPVCLNEFEEDESLRLLPKCNHAFHISCIDTWLSSHTNCPLCRAGIAVISASGPVDVASEGSGSNFENNGVGEEDQDRGEIGDESGIKERDDSEHTELNSDVRIEISGSETESKDEVRVLVECLDSNGEDLIDSHSQTKTHIESVNFPGKSCENQNQNFTRPIGGYEASSSESNGGRESIDSGELNGEGTEDTEKSEADIMVKTNGSSSVSCFNKNKSSVFPL